MPAIYLADVIRTLAGWPIDLSKAAEILAIADEKLAADGGRDCRRALRDDEVVALFGITPDMIAPREPVDRQWPLRLGTDLHRRIRDCASAAGLSMNLWALQALQAAVEAQEREEE